jgi:hypothetical protein
MVAPMPIVIVSRHVIVYEGARSNPRIVCRKSSKIAVIAGACDRA